jgi:hypothetical protein
LKQLVALALSVALTACAASTTVKADTAPHAAQESPAPSDQRIVFPVSASQGALVFGKVPSGSVVRYGGRVLQADALRNRGVWCRPR